MRRLLFLFLFFISVHTFFGRDSTRVNKKIVIGSEANVTSGFYTISLGASLLFNSRHAVSIGISVLVPESPTKEKWYRGAYLDYNFFFKKMRTQRLTPYFLFSLQYLNTGWRSEDYVEWGFHSNNYFKYETRINSLYGLLGLGINLKITKKLFFKTSVSLPTFDYSNSSTTQQNLITGQTYSYRRKHLYNDLYGLSFDDLFLKCSLTYYFK